MRATQYSYDQGKTNGWMDKNSPYGRSLLTGKRPRYPGESLSLE